MNYGHGYDSVDCRAPAAHITLDHGRAKTYERLNNNKKGIK